MAAGSIKFACPHCHRRCKVPLELAGKRGRCPGCERALEVPLPDDEPPPEAGEDEEEPEQAKPQKVHWTIKVGLACIICLPLPGLIVSWFGLQKARKAERHVQIAWVAFSLNAASIVVNMIYMAVKM